jgi:hypothetical protein
MMLWREIFFSWSLLHDPRDRSLRLKPRMTEAVDACHGHVYVVSVGSRYKLTCADVANAGGEIR